MRLLLLCFALSAQAQAPERPDRLDGAFHLAVPPAWSRLQAPPLQLAPRMAYDARPMQEDIRRQLRLQQGEGLWRLAVEALRGTRAYR